MTGKAHNVFFLGDLVDLANDHARSQLIELWKCCVCGRQFIVQIQDGALAHATGNMDKKCSRPDCGHKR